VLRLDKLRVNLIQASKEIQNDAVVDPSLELFIKVQPSIIRPFEEGRLTFSALVKVRPVLEWVELTETADGRISAWNLSTGEYRFAIVHRGQLVWTRGFKVALRATSTSPKPIADLELHEEARSETFSQVALDFMSKSDNIPPAVVGLGLEGRRHVVNSSALNLSRIFDSFLKKYAPRGLVFFVTVENRVPRYLSDALFASGTPWLALSYPCPRDSEAMSVADFVKRMTAPTGTARSEIHGIRKVPRQDIRKWTPTMSVLCPQCGTNLRVDASLNQWKTSCWCGFQSANVGYSLYNLNEDKYRVFVLQFALFEYLIGVSRSKFGRLLGGALRCGKCGYPTPFRDPHEIMTISKRFDQTGTYARLPGDLAFFASDGWWEYTGGRYQWSSKLRIIMGGHCPKCCAGHLSFPECATPPLVTGLGETVILLVGLEQLAFPETDPFFITSDPFPPSLYPRLEGVTDPFMKVSNMVRSCDTWWQGR
jgi:hypothetical protein